MVSQREHLVGTICKAPSVAAPENMGRRKAKFFQDYGIALVLRHPKTRRFL